LRKPQRHKGREASPPFLLSLLLLLLVIVVVVEGRGGKREGGSVGLHASEKGKKLRGKNLGEI